MNMIAWLMRLQAETAMIRKYGVSRAYAREVISTSDAAARGEIGFDVSQHRLYAIAHRYPEDAALMVDGAYRRGDFA